jgi:hypothetical protein
VPFRRQRDKARPTTHARNLYHFSVACWDTWTVYNGAATLRRVLVRDIERVEIADAAARANATDEAISFAVFGLLRHRFTKAADNVQVGSFLNRTMARLGYDVALAGLPAPSGARPLLPHQVGNKVAAAIIAHGLADGSCESDDYECPVGHPHHYTPKNRFPLNPYWNGPGAVEDPNRWQSLEIGQFIDQAGIAVNGYPPFTGPQWGFVTPFALERETHGRLSVDGVSERSAPRDAAFDGVYFDPGAPPQWGRDSPTHREFVNNFTVTLKVSSMVSVQFGGFVSASPGNSSFGSNNFFAQQKCDLTPDELCHNVGIGHAVNPATGEPYAANRVLRGDYTRVLAEFWADGPQSETPPGHWNSIVNRVVDHPAFERRWGGAGAELGELEFSVRAYLALNAALHDAAVAAWGIKMKYDGPRPISAIRWMASLGQSSNRSAPSYHFGGLPIVPGHTYVVRLEDVCAGRCELETGFVPGPLWELGKDAVGQVVGFAWDSLSFHCAGVCFYPAQDWKTYQRPSFVTPPFAGFVSGHSTFSRAAADMLTQITGSAYFPGGMGRFLAPGGLAAISNNTDFLVFEDGPSQPVEMQWATYGDASDECSLSRIYGGIHPPADDLPGRRIGRLVAQTAWAKLVRDVFGPVAGTRAAVRLRFDGDGGTPTRFMGSENATRQWAVDVALSAHRDAALRDADGSALSDDGVTARLLPRQPGEAPNERTVLLLGAHRDSTDELVHRFLQEAGVESVVVLECNPLSCTPRSGVYLAVPILLSLFAVLVLAVVVVLALWRLRARKRANVLRAQLQATDASAGTVELELDAANGVVELETMPQH